MGPCVFADHCDHQLRSPKVFYTGVKMIKVVTLHQKCRTLFFTIMLCRFSEFNVKCRGAYFFCWKYIDLNIPDVSITRTKRLKACDIYFPLKPHCVKRLRGITKFGKLTDVICATNQLSGEGPSSILL